jgi:hypothetical protein
LQRAVVYVGKYGFYLGFSDMAELELFRVEGSNWMGTYSQRKKLERGNSSFFTAPLIIL